MFDKNLVHSIIGGKDLDCGSAELSPPQEPLERYLNASGILQRLAAALSIVSNSMSVEV